MESNARIDHLRVKIKSLAAEARIIRHEEAVVRSARFDPVLVDTCFTRFAARYEAAGESSCHELNDHAARRWAASARWARANPEASAAARAKADARFWSLRHHRNGLGPVARVALLAYGFLRGREYAAIEATVRADNQPDLAAVEKEAIKFGPVNEDALELWLARAKAHLDAQDAARRKTARAKLDAEKAAAKASMRAEMKQRSELARRQRLATSLS